MSISDNLIRENPAVKLLQDKYNKLQTCVRDVTVTAKVQIDWGDEFDNMASFSERDLLINFDKAVELLKADLKKEYKNLYKEATLLSKEFGVKPQRLFEIVIGAR